jgi:broad specificity phosphatase PhoE
MKKDHVTFQRRPFLAPLWLSALGMLMAVTALGFAVFASWVWVTADSTTVVVIRDAEKEPGTAVDPPLTAAGEGRAALLATMFGEAKGLGRVEAIYVSPALRNRLTAAPLAARLGIEATVAPDDPEALARRVLHEHSGGRVLIVGHSDTVPAVVGALTGNKQIPPIGDEEYGTMYIVTVPRVGHANLLRLNY